MMNKQFITVQAGEENFPACWDMTAWATFEKLSGADGAFAGFKINASNTLDALWSAIDAAAAHRDQEAPITRRRLGTLYTSQKQMIDALNVVTKLVKGFMPEAKAQGKADGGASAASASPSPDATSSPPATLELVNATSGD
jgi:hypothetical protein